MGNQFQRKVVLGASFFVAHQNVVGDQLHAKRVFSKILNYFKFHFFKILGFGVLGFWGFGGEIQF